MASNPTASRLTVTYRQQQGLIGAQTARAMIDTFGLLDPANLDGTVERWLRTVVPVVNRQRVESARLAGGYYQAFRRLEIGSGEIFVPRLAAVAPAEQVVTSLTVTGPVKVKQATALSGGDIVKAADEGAASVARAAVRLALDGGRQTLLDSMNDDQRALGWARSASGNACAFCAMLASRGPVYKEDSVGFQSHDGCGCTPEPVFSEDADWPAGSREYQQMWQDLTDGQSGPDAVNAFRRGFSR